MQMSSPALKCHGGLRGIMDFSVHWKSPRACLPLPPGGGQTVAWAHGDMVAQGASARAVLQSNLHSAGSTEADQHLLKLYDLKPVTTYLNAQSPFS